MIHHCEQEANKHILQLLVCSVCSAILAYAAYANDGVHLIKTIVVGARSVFALILVISNTFCFLKAAFYQLVNLVWLSLFFQASCPSQALCVPRLTDTVTYECRHTLTHYLVIKRILISGEWVLIRGKFTQSI